MMVVGLFLQLLDRAYTREAQLEREVEQLRAELQATRERLARLQNPPPGPRAEGVRHG